MRIIRRPLAPLEIDYELVWLNVSLGGLALAAAWLTVGLPWPHCFFLAITGHPCITCGATRCAIALFHANFCTALRWNPLIFAALCGLAIFDIYAFAVLVFRAPRVRVIQLSAIEKSFLRVAVIVLFLANWIYLLSRPPGVF